MRIYEGRARYRPAGKFSTWLFAIAANLCRNLARSRERHPAVSLNTPAADGEPLETTLPATISRAKNSPRQAFAMEAEDCRESDQNGAAISGLALSARNTVNALGSNATA